MSRPVGLQRAVRAALVIAAMQTSVSALALGLGEMELRSFLNEPLRAEVSLLDLRGLAAEDIRIRLGAVEDFDRLGVDRSYFLTGIEFEVVVDQRTGAGVIRLTSDDAVLEPYLDLIIEARWPTGRLLRNYTVLVDPPAFRQEVLTVSASEEVRKTEAAAAAQTQARPSQSEPVSSGDSVRRLESDLPPGEMPDRPFSSETSLQPSAGSRYMVKRDETLWQIASRARPGDTSVQQAMLDIQRLNPEAFIDGNINRIKAGYIIYLPDTGDISSDDLASALDEVREQNLAFESRRREPGVTAAATLRVSADTGDSPARDSADDMGPSGVASTGDGTGDAVSASSSAADVAEAGESAASAALAAQLDAMATRLDTLEQIVALKDEQIATLEQALREAREGAQVAASAAASGTQPQAVTPPAPAQTPATAPPTTPSPTPAASDAADDSSGSGFPILPLFGGVVILAGLLFFALFRRRRAAADQDALDAMGRDSEDDVFAGVSLKREALDDEGAEDEATAPAELPESDDDEDVAPPVEDLPKEDSPKAVSDNRGYGERKHDDYIDEASGGDALAEADIYIAYGRYLQAIELLNGAIEEEPENSAYRLKLIELYVDMGEEKDAQEQLRKLKAGGDAEAIARAEALVGGGLGAVDYEEAAEPPAAEPGDEAPIDEDIAADADPEVDEDAAVVAELADDQGSTDAPTEPEEEATAPHESEAAGEAVEELDLELPDLTDELEDFSDSDVADDETAVADGVPDEHADDDEPSADFLRDDSLQMEPMEFEGLQIEDADDSAEGDSASDGSLNVDDDGDLDLSEALAEAEDEADEPSGNGEELVIAEDADQMATKLDLARAYLDMGDGAGARVILEEVMGNGTGEQQQEARELLSRID